MSAQIMPNMKNNDLCSEDHPDEKIVNQLIPGILLTIIILVLLGITIVKLSDPSTLPIRHVSVAGEFIHLSPTNLQYRVSAVVRGGFFNVNVETIQQALLQEPWVREVSVKRVWPDRVTVNIREQTAIAQWGDSGLLNPDAQIFYPEPSTFPDNMPIVMGPENTSHQVMDALFQIQKILPEELKLTQLVLSDRRSWRLIINNKLILRLGKTQIFNRINKFFEYFPVGEISNFEQIQYVDMRYTNGFVVRWNPENEPDLTNRQEYYGEKI